MYWKRGCTDDIYNNNDKDDGVYNDHVSNDDVDDFQSIMMMVAMVMIWCK